VFSGGWIIAYLLSCGYWDLELYKETGNPFFPLFNGIFRSTWAPEQNFSDGRFFPHGMVEMLFYPFFWMQKSAITVIESPFVDPRFAIVFSLTAVIGLTFLFLWIKRGRPKGDVIDLEQIDIILIFSFTSFYIWETLFSILRYLIEVEALLGVFMLCVALRSTVSLGVRISYRLCSVFMAFLLLVVSIVTVYPQMGRVKFSNNEFEITHTQLPHRSLVILAGVPIGYLVPFLVGDDPASRIIGMNDTIGLSQQTGLGAIISHEISTWTGPIFVVARHDTLISASQLSSYHLFPMGNCSIIHENIDSENFICPLTLSPNTNKWPSVGSTP